MIGVAVTLACLLMLAVWLTKNNTEKTNFVLSRTNRILFLLRNVSLDVIVEYFPLVVSVEI